MKFGDASVKVKIVLGLIVPMCVVFLVTLLVVRMLLTSTVEKVIREDVVSILTSEIEKSTGRVNGLLEEQRAKSAQELARDGERRLAEFADAVAQASLPMIEAFNTDGVRQFVANKVGRQEEVRQVVVRSGSDTITVGEKPANPATASAEVKSSFAKVSVEVFADRTGMERALQEQKARFGSVIGELNGSIVVLTKSLSDRSAQAGQEITRRVNVPLTILFLCAAALLTAIGLFIVTALSKRLSAALGLSETLASGDLTKSVEVDAMDEAGKLAASMNGMANTLRESIEKVKAGVLRLHDEAASISTLAREVDAATVSGREKSNSVAGSSAETTTSINTIASAIEESSSTIKSLAAAAEEMSATIREVSLSTHRAQQKAQGAAQAADSITGRVGDLEVASREIGAVTETIEAISEQTKLLALNATIEAARAGEAGKGFAVVAAEIKELAKQTSDSTHEIGSKVSQIQAVSLAVSEGIKGVAASMAEMNQAILSISSAIEEQAATTAEIARNVSESSAAIDEVTANAGLVAKAAKTTSTDVAQVAREIDKIAGTVHRLADSSSRLTGVAGDLERVAAWFKV